ncbi:MAG: holotricin-3 [Eggerthellaceae bacterium]|nr:holotricin-3 [Eggerthellaceae bacterium]
MHKSQRTKEAANDLHEDPNAKKWYQQTFWIVVLLLLFWPVGVVLMWRSDWHVAVKVIVSLVVAVYVAFAMYTVGAVPTSS